MSRNDVLVCLLCGFEMRFFFEVWELGEERVFGLRDMIIGLRTI